MDHRRTLKAHYDQLGAYLKSYEAIPNTRSNARLKLTKLTLQQFHELTTDVYEELVRRKITEKEAPFPLVREDSHPKRKLAREKMANLPTSRFQGLASDVRFELVHRFPEFEQNN